MVSHREAKIERIRVLNAAIFRCMRNCRDAGLTMSRAKPGSLKWLTAAEQQRMNFMYRVQLEERRGMINLDE